MRRRRRQHHPAHLHRRRRPVHRRRRTAVAASVKPAEVAKPATPSVTPLAVLDYDNMDRYAACLDVTILRLVIVFDWYIARRVLVRERKRAREASLII